MNPLVELHLHLDGSLRLNTMLDIAHRERLTLPASDETGLYKILRCGTVRESLADYLDAFPVTTSVMQSRYALARIARELIEDCAKEGLRYVEVRFMPFLHTDRGLRGSEVMEAVLQGLREGETRTGLQWGLLVCSMRHMPVRVTAEMMTLAIRYRNDGVVGVDMAGDDTISALEHAPHYLRAKEAGLGVTIHAAEAGPPVRAIEALEFFGADRLGHAIRIGEDRSVLERIIREGVPLEVCPTSNVQIRQVACYATHPAREYLRLGARVSIHTDNRMLADTTMEKEVRLVTEAWKLDVKLQAKLRTNPLFDSFSPEVVNSIMEG